MSATEGLVDRYGRVHRDLRVSLTDRCSLRCTYCMPAEGVPWIPGPDLLTTDELLRVVRVAVSLGVNEVRLTGGEPLLRPDVVDVVGRLSQLDSHLRLSVTTNGLRLGGLAAPLADAGLERVNVSLDTLRRDRFAAITRRDRLTEVIAGLAAASSVGLSPVKVNAVLVRGVNDDEATDLLAWALDGGYQLRFIEQMPLDAGQQWRREDMVTAEEILGSLPRRWTLEPIPVRGSEPAERFLVNGGPGVVGVVASVTRPFCGDCDRIRLTADGQLRACLFAHKEWDLRTAMREGADDAELERRIVAAVAGKLGGHGIDDPAFLQPRRPMSAIGG